MYTKQEASRLREMFWTTFGQYMRPILSADGEKVNWVNYKTGIQGIYFKMEADNKAASIAIVLSHANTHVRLSQYEQLLRLKNILRKSMDENWTWQQEVEDEHGRPISKIWMEINQVNIYNNADWPRLISFFKPRIVALDNFWSIAKYGLE